MAFLAGRKLGLAISIEIIGGEAGILITDHRIIEPRTPAADQPSGLTVGAGKPGEVKGINRAQIGGFGINLRQPLGQCALVKGGLGGGRCLRRILG